MRRSTIGATLAETGGSIKTGPFGTVLKASEYTTFGVPVISVGEIGYGSIKLSGKTPHVGKEVLDRLPDYTLRAGDIVFGRKGAVDRSAWVRLHEDGYFLGSDGIRLRFGSGVSSRFMAYQLQSRTIRRWLLQHAVGSTLASLNQPTLEAVPIALPPIAEQRGIAATLGALDDKMESNQRIIANAMHLARACVDRVTESSELVSYAHALQVQMGSAFKGTQFSSPGVGRPLLRIRDLKTFESQTWTTEARQDEVVIRPGDIVVGMDAEFRATLWLGAESVLNQRVCSFTGMPGVSRAFVLAALEPQLAFQESAKTGTTVIHLNKADIAIFEVPALTDAQHRALSKLTEPLIDLVVARSRESTSLAMFRDALLPELLSGRIRVPEAAETVTEAIA